MVNILKTIRGAHIAAKPQVNLLTGT